MGRRCWVIFAGSVIPALASCSVIDEPGYALCGPCGSIESGTITVSGNAQLDGFFAAVVELDRATATVSGNFVADVTALGEVYGVAPGDVNDTFVDDVIAAIEADVDAHTEGGLQMTIKPPVCTASVEVAVDAQTKCEAQAGCEVMADPGAVSVQCEGSCLGGCSGGCSGDLSCAITKPTVDCEGMCEGSCALSAAAICDGVCHGQCDAACSAQDQNGECHGRCQGMCQGTCEIETEASCTGTCHGTCKVDQSSTQCTGEVECAGSCDGECSGSCEGNFTPPGASADCEASADCKAQASAQASASLECTPPTIDIDFVFKAGIDASAQAAFIARLAKLEARGAAILQGMARFEALITGEVDGKVVFDPSPVANITAQLQGLITGGVDGDFEIPPGRLPCVIPAMEGIVAALSRLGTDAQPTLSAGRKIVLFFTSG